MNYKDRCFAVTVNPGHENLQIWLTMIAILYDDGAIDYGCISMEEAGELHLQGFVTFNETNWTNAKEEEREFKPTDLLSGHWTKARSLSGARDYCAREGIHVAKHGHYQSFEFGDWVDPAWNQGLRSRKIYEFAHHIKEGATVQALCQIDLAGVGLLGYAAVDTLVHQYGLGRSVSENCIKRPYYYIGSLQLEKYVQNLIETHGLKSKIEVQRDEEE